MYLSQVIYCGGYSGEDPPLPIPNREVKLTSADGTAPPGGRVGSCRFSKSSSLNRPELFFFAAADAILYLPFGALFEKARIVPIRAFFLRHLTFFSPAASEAAAGAGSCRFSTGKEQKRPPRAKSVLHPRMRSGG